MIPSPSRGNPSPPGACRAQPDRLLPLSALFKKLFDLKALCSLAGRAKSLFLREARIGKPRRRDLTNPGRLWRLSSRREGGFEAVPAGAAIGEDKKGKKMLIFIDLRSSHRRHLSLCALFFPASSSIGDEDPVRPCRSPRGPGPSSREGAKRRRSRTKRTRSANLRTRPGRPRRAFQVRSNLLVVLARGEDRAPPAPSPAGRWRFHPSLPAEARDSRDGKGRKPPAGHANHKEGEPETSRLRLPLPFATIRRGDVRQRR